MPQSLSTPSLHTSVAPGLVVASAPSQSSVSFASLFAESSH